VGNYFRNKKAELFWNGIISFANEFYLVLCFVSFVNLTELRYNSFGESLGSICAVIGSAFVITFPLIIFVLYRCKWKKAIPDLPEDLAAKDPSLKDVIMNCNEYEVEQIYLIKYSIEEDVEFKQRYGTLIMGLNAKRLGVHLCTMQPVVSLLRRLFLAFSVVFLSNYPTF